MRERRSRQRRSIPYVMRWASALGFSVLAICLLGPANASAWTVTRGDGIQFGPNQLTVTAAPGEINDIEIFVSGPSPETGTLSVFDRNSNPVVIGGTCAPFPMPAPGTGVGATCGSYAELGRGVVVTLADGNDMLDIVWPFRSAGFPGVSADGGDGDDLIIGGQGVSALEGGPGNDTLGADSPCCGEPFEAGDDTMSGGPGNDKITGGEGSDKLEGGEGNDRIFGDRGEPENDGNDRISGGAGNDLIVGDGGKDFLFGNGGIDQLSGLDGIRDRKIDCGPGRNSRERVFVDRRDPKPISCKKAKKKRKK